LLWRASSPTRRRSRKRSGSAISSETSGVGLINESRAIREAIRFHIDGLREDGMAIPKPTSRVDYVEVAA
jgi:hypothetical protein